MKTHMGQFPQDGENGQNVTFLHYFCCSAVIKRFDFCQLFSTVLKRFCPLDSKNVFVLVLAHREPELELSKQSNRLVTAEFQKIEEMSHFDHFPRPEEIDPYVKLMNENIYDLGSYTICEIGKEIFGL